MSGLFLSTSSLETARVDRILEDLSFTDGEWTTSTRESGFTLAQVRSDRKRLWYPATDEETGTTVAIVGRVALTKEEWRRAESLPLTGGLACRHVLDGFLKRGRDFVPELNGSFCVVLLRPPEGTLHVVTDRMGFLAMYCRDSSKGTVMATHPDVLARHVAAGTSFDLVSMIEMITTAQVTHPHTYYRGIKSLDPACVYTYDGEGLRDRRPYWEPKYRGRESASVSELGEQLEHALRRAVERRTQRTLGRVGLLLSGGADSRAMLYAAREPEEVISITIYETKNAEFETAARLARRAGSRLVSLRRDFEHYGLGAEETVRLSGGMWNLSDGHFTEFIPDIQELDLGILISGCYADLLFKGLALNRRHKTWFGKTFPLQEFAPFSYEWYHGHSRIPTGWRSDVQGRLEEKYRGLDRTDESDEGRWWLELRRARPVARSCGTAQRLALWPTLPWDFVLADSDLIRMYETIPPSRKLNGQVWENAVDRICRDVRDIRNNNSLSRVGSSPGVKVLEFLRGVAHRKLFKRDVDGTPLDGSVTRGSWPDYVYYATHSKVLPRLWNDPDGTTREVMGELLETDPWDRSIDAWVSQGCLLFYRLVTLKLWLDQRNC